MSRFTMPVAVHLFLMKDDQVLFLRRCNTGYEDGNYSVVAGHIDGNENMIQAMIREAKEEAGITISEENMLPIQVMHRKTSVGERIDYFFLARTWIGEITNMEPNKCDALKWFPSHQRPHNIIPYINYALDRIKDNQHFTKFGW